MRIVFELHPVAQRRRARNRTKYDVTFVMNSSAPRRVESKSENGRVANEPQLCEASRPNGGHAPVAAADTAADGRLELTSAIRNIIETIPIRAIAAAVPEIQAVGAIHSGVSDDLVAPFLLFTDTDMYTRSPDDEVLCALSSIPIQPYVTLRSR